MKEKNIFFKLIPIMLAFFVMGFVDLVGIATNYVKADFDLSDTLANLFPSMVFFWFLIFSVPTGILMNRIGRRKTVLLSLAVTAVSLVLPLISYSFISMLISFSLLGIGNALMQTSLNPLLSNIVSNERLASSMTFGQFVKAIASFLAPIIAAWAAASFGDWKFLFPIFMAIAVLAILGLSTVEIKEQDEKGETSTFAQCFALLGDKMIFLSFLGIMCHVGIDVGVNVTAPKILIERLDMDLSAAGYATSVYFLFRTIGCLLGTFILAKFSSRLFFLVSVVAMVLGFGGLFFLGDLTSIYVCIGLIGFGNSNIFPIIMSQALLNRPDKKNEVSGLLIMGLFGGTIFPLIMGIASDAMQTQVGALIVMSFGVLYLFAFTGKLKNT
ncbi:MFS transporter [Parabacteroides sp. PF5-6]|uniref:MFS transporter n=1 Tax=Parabacteroides sp. PF5-6 TaxID=1742403 RepID=UPI002404B198|nr:MFS transporter [Parabacteroides sp. PF5-6]MDF9830126.1 fucose permease [Parabacteroides sp. PF5-6]